tara:strand:+ start:16555 stop:16755 length:201 start_codon:yes stop_codon:yes gene_type:complete
MKISELIKQLQEQKEIHGDVECKIAEYDGYWDVWSLYDGIELNGSYSFKDLTIIESSGNCKEIRRK